MAQNYSKGRKDLAVPFLWECDEYEKSVIDCVYSPIDYVDF
jgi:hypothetical protein